MKTIALCSVGALLLGASIMGCTDEPEQPAVHSSVAVVSQPPPPQQGATVTIVHHAQPAGVTEVQPAAQPPAAQAQPNAPVINNFVTAESPGAPPPAVAPQETPAAQPTDGRALASQVVAEATQQIDRLTRVLAMSARDDRHAKIEAALGQLQAKRERVLRDMHSIDTTAASSSDDAQRIVLNRDVSDLQTTLQDSYQYAPPSMQ